MTDSEFIIKQLAALGETVTFLVKKYEKVEKIEKAVVAINKDLNQHLGSPMKSVKILQMLPPHEYRKKKIR